MTDNNSNGSSEENFEFKKRKEFYDYMVKKYNLKSIAQKDEQVRKNIESLYDSPFEFGKFLKYVNEQEKKKCEDVFMDKIMDYKGDIEKIEKGGVIGNILNKDPQKKALNKVFDILTGERNYQKQIEEEIMDAYSWLRTGAPKISREYLSKLKRYDLPILFNGDQKAVDRMRKAIIRLEGRLSTQK